jgi:uncharacterized Zn finger protein
VPIPPEQATPRSVLGMRWWETIERVFAPQRNMLIEAQGIVRDARVRSVFVTEGQLSAQFMLRSIPPDAETLARVEPLPHAVWERVIEQLASRAAYVSQLESGELPANLEAIVAEAGGELFPTDPAAYSRECVCHIPGPICPHAAAAHYVLALNIGLQAQLLLTFRGYNAGALTERVRLRWSELEASGRAPAEPLDAHPHDEPEQRPLVEPLRSDGFYTAGHVLDDFSVTIEPPQVEAALLKRLGNPPFVEPEEDVVQPLAAVYAAVTKRALAALERSRDRPRKRGK